MASTAILLKPSTRRTRLKRILWSAMIVLCVIAAAAVIRRCVALAYPPQHAPAQLAELDAAFARRPAATLTHILPALVFVALIPFQLSRQFRSRHLRAHRWMGRIAVVLGAIIALSALALARDPIGGTLELSAILIFDALFAFSLFKGYLCARSRNVARHREWMIRALAVALGIATVRPIMGMFFATSPLTGLGPHQFFGMAFWLGFSITYLAGELWIRYTQPVHAVTP